MSVHETGGEEFTGEEGVSLCPCHLSETHREDLHFPSLCSSFTTVEKFILFMNACLWRRKCLLIFILWLSKNILRRINFPTICLSHIQWYGRINGEVMCMSRLNGTSSFPTLSKILSSWYIYAHWVYITVFLISLLSTHHLRKAWILPLFCSSLERFHLVPCGRQCFCPRKVLSLTFPLCKLPCYFLLSA